MLRMFSWNNGESSKTLADALGIKRLRHDRSRWRPRRGDWLLNWGLGVTLPLAQVINHPDRVRLVTNKLTFFNVRHEGYNLPPHTTNPVAVRQWLMAGEKVVVRHELNGHEGRGIEVLETPDAIIPRAPLYTLYVPKRDEYRVHVFGGEVIAQAKKVLRVNGRPDGAVNWHVRNFNNGFVFQHERIIVPGEVRSSAVNAVRTVGLDFGAVDVIVGSRDHRAYVLEINTAPGIEGERVTQYANAIRRHCG